MSGRRRKSKKLKTAGEESDEFEPSFTMQEVKENLRTIGEKFLKWIIEGVQSETKEKVQEMALSVRKMRNFLIDRKKRVEQSKSMRQLKQLETLSPLLDSAKYLTSVAKDYLTKVEEDRDKDEPQEHEDVNVHDSSFVDMFLDDSLEKAGRNAESQKDTVAEDNTQNMTQSLKATPSRSILKTTFSETPGIQKKISFAKKATKVYEDNETSQISLAKSSGSVKSVDEYNPKAPNPRLASAETGSACKFTFGTQMNMEENLRQASEDMFDDAESVVDSSFQEHMLFPAKPKNVKLFKAKNLTDFSREKSKSDENSTSFTNQVNGTDQDIEPDPLLSQETPNFKQDANMSTKGPQTEATLPFHNFVLKLPYDSSGSEASLDARVNMAINLVNMKPREPEIKQQPSPSDEVEMRQHSSEGMVQSSVTCTDFRWLERMEYNRGTSQDSSIDDIPRFQEPKLSATIIEDAIGSKNLLPPFDILNENGIKILETPFLGKQPQETSVHDQEKRPQVSSSVFPPKPTWANPFQSSTAHLSSSHQVAQIDPVASEPEKSLKDRISNIIQSKNWGNSMSKTGQESITPKNKEEILQPTEAKLYPSNMAKNSRKSQNTRSSSKSAAAMLEVSKISQGTQGPPDTADIPQETYDSHKFAKTIKHRSRQSFKEALKDAVQTAKTRHPPDKPQKQDPADLKTAEASVVQPDPTPKTAQDSKIARLRRFGKCWNEPSSTPLPDTEINSTRTQSNLKLLDEISTGRSKSNRGKETVNINSQVKRKPWTKSKPSQGEGTASSKELPRKLNVGKDVFSDNQGCTKFGRNKIDTKREKIRSLNQQTTPLATKRENSTQNPNPITNVNFFPLSTPLPDTVLADNAQLKNPARSGDTEGLSQINTSSMICKTSFSGQKSSQGHRKQANSSRTKIQLSQNKQKLATQQPQANSKLSQGKAPPTARSKQQWQQGLELTEQTQTGRNCNEKVETYRASLENLKCQTITKRGRGRPPKADKARKPAKKCALSTTSESVPIRTSNFEPQPVGQSETCLFSNKGSNILHPHSPAHRGLQLPKQDFHQPQQCLSSSKQDVEKCLPSSKPDFQQVQSLSSKQDIEQAPSFVKFQQLRDPEMFLQPQPAGKSNNFAGEPGQVFQTNWHQELTQQHLPSSQQDSAQTELGFLKFQQLQVSTEPSKQLAISASVNAERAIPVHAHRVSVQNEPWLLNLQQDDQISQTVSSSNKQENFDASFFKPQPDNTSNEFAQLFNQPPNAANFVQARQTIQTDWQFNFPLTSQAEPSFQKFPSSNAEPMRSEPQIQAPNINWMHFGPNGAEVDGGKDNISAELANTAEARVSSMALPMTVPATGDHFEENPTESSAGSQSKKRAGQAGTQQPKSPKMIRLQENEIKTSNDTDGVPRHSLGTQGTEVLYEECEHLSWASDNFPNTQMFDTQMINTQMFDTQLINTQMLDSHNFVLSQNADSPSVSNHNLRTAGNEGKQAEDESQFQFEAYTQLSWGFTAEREDPIPSFQAPLTQENYKHHDDFSGIHNANTSNHFNKDCGNTPFHQQDSKRDSGKVQSLSDANQLAPFTEFERGVQVSSTELIENTKSLQNPGFKEPDTKNEDENQKNQYGFESSTTDHARTKNVCASTNLNQDYITTRYHQQEPKRISETMQNLTDSNQPVYTEFKRGVQVSSTELAGNTKTPGNSALKEPAKKKTEAEELEELINSIEWVRRIPQSELIEAANIEELINDQTFVW